MQDQQKIWRRESKKDPGISQQKVFKWPKLTTVVTWNPTDKSFMLRSTDVTGNPVVQNCTLTKNKEMILKKKRRYHYKVDSDGNVSLDAQGNKIIQKISTYEVLEGSFEDISAILFEGVDFLSYKSNFPSSRLTVQLNQEAPVQSMEEEGEPLNRMLGTAGQKPIATCTKETSPPKLTLYGFGRGFSSELDRLAEDLIGDNITISDRLLKILGMCTDLLYVPDIIRNQTNDDIAAIFAKAKELNAQKLKKLPKRLSKAGYSWPKSKFDKFLSDPSPGSSKDLQ